MKVFSRTPLDLQEVRTPIGQVYLIPERCKGCRICVELCPMNVLEISSSINSKGYHYPELADGQEGKCVQCDFCTLICPEFAIYTLEVEA